MLSGTLLIGDGGTTGELGSGPVTISSGAGLQFQRSDTITVPNAISGAGQVFISLGTVIFPAANNYTGNTNMQSGGTLIVNGGSLPGTSGTGTGNVSASNSNLAGTGRIAGLVNIGTLGSIRGDSGNGTGTLTLDGGIRFRNTGVGGNPTLASQLTTDTGSISASSLLAVTGTSKFNIDLTGGGQFRVRLLNDAGLTMFQPYSLTLATGPSHGQNFQRNGIDLTDGFIFNAADYMIASESGNWFFPTSSLQIVNNTLVLNFVPVPEPGVLLVVMAMGLGLTVRRKPKM